MKTHDEFIHAFNTERSEGKGFEVQLQDGTPIVTGFLHEDQALDLEVELNEAVTRAFVGRRYLNVPSIP